MGGMNLLIVDDEERFLTTTRALLEKKGVDTSIATNVADALQILSSEKIDVVILDVKMRGLDGIEGLRVIKKRFPLVEVILLTGHASAESAVEGLSLGAFNYLMKPCDVNALLEEAKAAFARKVDQEEKKRKEKIDKIIGHPLEVFEKD